MDTIRKIHKRSGLMTIRARITPDNALEVAKSMPVGNLVFCLRSGMDKRIAEQIAQKTKVETSPIAVQRKVSDNLGKLNQIDSARAFKLFADWAATGQKGDHEIVSWIDSLDTGDIDATSLFTIPLPPRRQRNAK